MILKLSIILAALLLSTSVHAIPVADVQNPATTHGSFVEDQGQVLGAEYSALIHAISYQLKEKTGDELAVIAVDNLDGLTVDDYAEQLFKRLGIGEKGKDNGVLILLSRDDRKIRIEVGYGLEPVLNDAKAGRLLDDNVVQFLKKNEFGRGLYAAEKVVALELAEAVKMSLQIADPDPWPVQPEVVFGVASPSTEVGKTTIVVLAMLFFTIVLTPLALIGKWIVWVRRKTRKGRKMALSSIDGMTSALVFLGPAGAIMVGYSEGVLWTGILLSLIPLAWGLLLVLGFRKCAQRMSSWAPKCETCHHPMKYEKTSTVEGEVQENKKVRVAEQQEQWMCASCGAKKTLVDKVYMGSRSGSSWSYSRPSSGGGRSGGGSSGGGGASRGF